MTTAAASPEAPQGDREDPQAPPEAGTALQRASDAPQGPVSITSAARFGFDQDQLVALKRGIAPEASPEEFVILLELAARYQLDPFARQIWCAPMQGRDGPHSIFCGRDGYLAIADRQPDYRGMRSAPVYANDDFGVTFDDDGVHVHHRSGKPNATEASGDEPGEQGRGDLVGAYAIVKRDGREATYFFAAASEYRPENPNRNTPWAKQPSAMLVKCAQSNALRIAYSISGFVPSEEAEAVRRGPVNVTAEPPDACGDDEVGERLRAAVERVNGLRPGSYRPARLRMDLSGASDGERAAYADRVEAEAAALEAVRDPEPEVTDAEVVPDEPGDGQIG